jgi:hypothetical protein
MIRSVRIFRALERLSSGLLRDNFAPSALNNADDPKMGAGRGEEASDKAGVFYGNGI